MKHLYIEKYFDDDDNIKEITVEEKNGDFHKVFNTMVGVLKYYKLAIIENEVLGENYASVKLPQESGGYAIVEFIEVAND